MRQKISCFSLALVCSCFFFAAHPAGAAEPDQPKKLDILASFYPAYIMAKNVARDVPGVSVRSLTSSLTGCLHDYSLTAEDMRKLSGARVFVVNGAGMESFLDKIAAQRMNLEIVQLSEGIPLIKGERGRGDNPHVWVSITDAIAQVKNLGGALEKIDPDHKELYGKNTADYTAKLEILRRKMHAELGRYQGRPVITFHEAFPYFAREFGLKIAAVVEREPGAEPGAKELADTIDLVRKDRISVLFSEPQYPAAAAEAIARETGARVYVLDPAVSGPDDFDAYLKIMENNLKTLKTAFQ